MQRAIAGWARRIDRTNWGFFYDDMDVTSAKTEGTDPRQTAWRSRHPRLMLGGNFEGRPLEVDEGVEFLKMRLGGNFAVLENQNCLDESGDSRRRFQMSDIGFYRSDPTGILGRSPGVENGFEGGQFDRIAEGSPRSVGLDVANFMGFDSSAIEGFTHRISLRHSVGGGESVTASVLVGGGSAQHR